jgi:hypothetical protein
VSDFQTAGGSEIHLKVDGRSYSFSRDSNPAPPSNDTSSTPASSTDK